MYSELECGICYRTYNAGRRCPRELRCRHTFCQSCLLSLVLPQHLGAEDKSILCPLCRQNTSISTPNIRAELRVDEHVLDLLLEEGFLNRDDEEEDQVQEEGTEEGTTLPETPAEQSDSFAGSRGGRLRRNWRKVWSAISGRSFQQNVAHGDCMTNDDMRNLAMMSCYMF
ncbi:RING finger 223-like [Solea senegalensis]|uniref:RING finger 223-like n=1 Tax=Solea senegalensis TaxID=28829 RepID=A0AAV6QY23_SOLSE|nr:E3 ubiquitin-protein ligase-like [Solea senegalensis]KAG7497233.1 RING finger 223-like [Solea senegalensis]